MNNKPDIHNFCIIAHIDHGKSTLADRMLEITGTVEKRKMKAQLLDSMDLEREKGITIKLQPVRMNWKGAVLNLIDTPGHVDFQYEVSRSLQAVEGAILLVDATQGVQAQTIANLYLAVENNLKIIPVINKIDLPAANVAKVTAEIKHLLGEEAVHEIIAISAKRGDNVDKVLDAVIAKVPSVPQDVAAPLRALIFDSVYDDYKGVVAYVRVIEGTVKSQDMITFLATNVGDHAVEVGTFGPQFQATNTLSAGEIGYIATSLKEVRQARVGDTITLSASKDKVKALPGFTIPQPKVFAGIYPEGGDGFVVLREGIEKLQLSDSSLTAQAERSEALGQGFRCGFLGMLHLEIIQERLKREYGLKLIITTPSVMYRLITTTGQTLEVHTPAAFPDPSQIASTEEQMVKAEIVTPTEYLGPVFELMRQREGRLENQEYLDTDRIVLRYSVPLRELVIDLYDHLKSVTSGYASLSYELAHWQPADVVKLSVFVNHEPVEALATIVPRDKAEKIGRQIVEKLKEVIPRQMFTIPLQAAVGGHFVARETLTAMKKDVIGGLYGGDYSRKKKLLEKQKKGKKKMASVGSVDIPAEAYIAVLKRS